MMSSWTASLTPSLSRLTGGRDWMRIHESRNGWWLLTEADPGGERWFHVADGSDTPQPVGVFDDERLPATRGVVGGWLAGGRRVELLAWRPGRRAVFRVGTADGTQICKLYRKDRHNTLRWTSLAQHASDRWRVPSVLGWDPETLCLTIEECPGRSLNQRWLAGEGAVTDGDRIAGLLNWLATATPPPGLPTHEASDEIALLEKRIASFERTLERPPRAAAELTRRVIVTLATEATAAPILSHRDLHDKQVLLAGERGCLIDLDLMALAPPALDLGNLLAHLRLRALQGSRLPWQSIVATTLRQVGREHGRDAGLGTWVAATLLRLGLIYSRRRRDPGLLASLLDSSAQALDRRGEWAGLA
jgi:hypothetical protein